MKRPTLEKPTGEQLIIQASSGQSQTKDSHRRDTTVVALGAVEEVIKLSSGDYSIHQRLFFRFTWLSLYRSGNHARDNVLLSKNINNKHR